jgi:ribonuclease P protein subunit POP4
MRTEKNILVHELIGLECEVVEARNASNIGIRGKITDETMKTVAIGEKMILKNGTVFRVKVGDKTVDIEGDFLASRPEDRIKKKIKKW